jgi:signal transduction histidine kinase
MGIDDAQHAVAALRAGAHDYLSQGVAADDLSRSIFWAIKEHSEQAGASTATAAQEGFIRSLSHEARTPLTAVVGFSELLSTTDLDTQQREWTERIGVAGQHLLGLMNDMIAISNLASGNFELILEAVPADEVVDECLGLVEPMTAKQGLILRREHAERVQLLADRQRLAQVLLNLFVNAVKYNRPGGSVTVRTRALEAQARIEVIDTGYGIPRPLVNRLFVPFERLDAPTRGIPGTGLGLSISRTLVEAMGGTISVQSEPGKGSTFAVQLPLVA